MSFYRCILYLSLINLKKKQITFFLLTLNVYFTGTEKALILKVFASTLLWPCLIFPFSCVGLCAPTLPPHSTPTITLLSSVTSPKLCSPCPCSPHLDPITLHSLSTQQPLYVAFHEQLHSSSRKILIPPAWHLIMFEELVSENVFLEAAVLLALACCGFSSNQFRMWI